MPEFQVFFNDWTSNDFNTLFATLPQNKQYYVLTPKNVDETQLSVSHKMPEFQVFFNDRTSNDFNTLFASLPQNKQYYAAGVPGSFYVRHFPKPSLHFAYSSCSLHWLSEDLDSFLNARAEELVFGGLMAFLVGSETNHTKNMSNISFPSLELLGSCLMDLAKEVNIDIPLL
ncbi:unnamed protein product [Fraxinus pennsylvanica]|uniref:Uncharacterized protein n=1 Tax=Fraxinus pennsylvanica TaxID=56036 RepID=A0AAD1Z606_9LAMI|nr:unnamed protein product [Fraxinus pennsylvanica]